MGDCYDIYREYVRVRKDAWEEQQAEITRLREAISEDMCPLNDYLHVKTERDEAIDQVKVLDHMYTLAQQGITELQAEIERLRLAYDALRHATLAAHSSHFDRTGGSGTGCLACIDIRAARKNADEVAGYPWLEEK